VNRCKLRQSVVIQERTETTNSTGEVEWSWSTFKTCRAAVEPLRGQEYFASRQLQSSTTTRIRIRYVSGITTKMRVVHASRYYAIEGIINPESRNRELQLMCVEREADGFRNG
jgi:SPP1 family predicted phage head-tail adaptor